MRRSKETMRRRNLRSRRKTMFCLCLGLVMAASPAVSWLTPTVYAAENFSDTAASYTQTEFWDDFSSVEKSAAKWSISPDIQEGKNVLSLGQHYNMKDENGSLIQVGNAVYEMKVSVNGSDWVGLLFNRQDPGHIWDNSGCLVYMGSDGKIVVHEPTTANRTITYANGTDGSIPGYQNGDEVVLQVISENGQVSVYADGEWIVTADTAYTSGYAGFMCSGRSGSGTIDDVTVKTEPLVQDSEEEINAVFETIKSALDESVVYIDSEEISNLPQISEEGYSCYATASSDESVIKTDGTVIPPSEAAEVTVTYEMRYEFGETVVDKETYDVTYNVKEKTTEEDIAFFKDDKYGLFVHYVWSGVRRINAGGTPQQISARYPDGTKAETIDEMIENFDAEKFAEDCKAMGAQYVFFTAWHYGMNPVYPSKVYEEWRTHEEEDLPSEDNDLIEKVYQELNKQGIDLYLYTHPYDIHDFYPEDQEKFDYKYLGDLTFNYDKYNDYLNAQYKELCERYKGKIKGLFLDEGLGNPPNNLSVDYLRLRDTIKSVDPSIVMIQNHYNGKYSCDTSMSEIPNNHWHGGEYDNLSTWKVKDLPIATTIGHFYDANEYSWWAIYDRGTQGRIQSAENAYLYTILQAGSNTEGGGMCWAAGPYCGSDDNGEIWEDGIKETLLKVYDYLKPVEEAVKNTRPSASYPTPSDSTIDTVSWGVATESADAEKTYIHVLKPTEGSQSVSLGVPADGKVFQAAYLLEDKTPVGLQQDEKGITLTLPEDKKWDELNTVIVLTTKEILPADKTDLKEAIESAEQVETEKYTEETAEKFLAELEAAKIVLNDDTLTEDDQAIVDEALNDLEKAQAALVLKDTDDGKEPSEPENPDTPKEPDGDGKPSDTDSGNAADQNEGGKGESVAQTGSDVPSTGDAAGGLYAAAALAAASAGAVITFARKRIKK